MPIFFGLFNLSSWIIAGYKWGDWKHWHKYYSTILFYICSDLIQNLVTYHYTLWQHTPYLLNAIFSNLLMAFISFSSTVIIYIYHYPNHRSRFTKLIYILCWATLYTIIEMIFTTIGMIYYEHGWNLIWSFAFNVVTFPLLLLHFRKPPLAWLVAFALGISIFVGFHIPLHSIK